MLKSNVGLYKQNSPFYAFPPFLRTQYMAPPSFHKTDFPNQGSARINLANAALVPLTLRPL